MKYRSRGFTLAEMAVALGIVLLLMAVATPFFLRHRGHTSVNRAAEIVKAVVERGTEEAKTAGYPLPEELLKDGLAEEAVNATPEAMVSVRLRKRSAPGRPAEILNSHQLPRSNTYRVLFANLGRYDLDANGDSVGLYVEFIQSLGGVETVLATLPIDVNGEFVLAGSSGNAVVRFDFTGYFREVTVTARGVVTSDQR